MELKIFNLNCWLLPPPFSVQNKARLQSIIKLIQEYNPDVITLQEVWLQAYVAILQNELRTYNFVASYEPFFNRGGLVTGVRKNVTAKIFPHTFPQMKEYSTTEKYGSKGYHEITVSNLSLINTHLYAPTNTFEESITSYQFSLLCGFFYKKNGILAGDLNMEQEKLHGQGIFRFFKTESTLSKDNSYANWGFNKTLFSKQIDYVLPTENIQVGVEVLRDEVSDHYPLIGSVVN